MSGMTRSMPNISSSGNISPQSMTTISSPYSNTYMFLPISPTPPSGMMRSGCRPRVRSSRVRSSVGTWLEEGQLGRGGLAGTRRGIELAVSGDPHSVAPVGGGRRLGWRSGRRGDGYGSGGCRVDGTRGSLPLTLAVSRRRRASSKASGRRRCPRSSRPRCPCPERLPPGGTWRMPAHPRRRFRDRPGAVPCACADPRAGHEPGHREPAERHDQRRIQHVQLSVQVRRTCRHLVRLRVAVARVAGT